MFPSAAVAFTAATFWVLDRAGALSNPLAGIEAQAIAHPLVAVAGLALVAVAAHAFRSPTARAPADEAPAAGSQLSARSATARGRGTA